MLQKSLVAVAKNATTPLKKLEVGTESPLKKLKRREKMNKTTVTEIGYFVHDYPMSEYECNGCGDEFVDRDDDYVFCPYCGKKIIEIIDKKG